MSKGGGAGKVYFVLYLAVVLELLIIIVERDEAEEHLHKKQQETMKIVESILSQLQSGAGSEGINTRPQDEITIPPPGVNIQELMGADIKAFRKYIVEVGVTDVTAAIKRKEGESDKEHNQRLQKLVELANVSELQYQVFFSPSPDPASAPMFQPEEYIKKNNIDFMKFQPGQRFDGPTGESWEFLGVRQLNLDKIATYNNLNVNQLKFTSDIVPVYPKDKEIKIGPDLAPTGLSIDSSFFYSDGESRKNVSNKGEGAQKRSFVVNFQPPSRAGWYKLRFVSRTNRILGVRSDQKAAELGDDATVNIGTVQLTVKDLRKVQKELNSTLDKFNLPSTDELVNTGNIDKFEEQLLVSKDKAMKENNAPELVGKIQLYGYIAKLLAPGMSSNFDQNRGNIEFNVRVVTPTPTMTDPTSAIPTTMACFDAVQHVFDFTITPYQSGGNTLEGKVTDQAGNVVSRLSFKPLWEVPGMNAAKPNNGNKADYRATLDTKLTPGNYKVEVKHTLSKKNTLSISDLFVFKTGLSEESVNKLNNKMSFASYGYPLTLDIIPNSGNKIAANQFRIYANFDNNNQRPPIEGLAITNEMNMKFVPENSKLNLRVTWMQPFTGTEIDLYAKKTFDIKQEEPNITLRGLGNEFKGQANKFKVRITGINVTKPFTGSDKEAQIKVRVGEATKTSGLQTYNVSAGPSIDNDGDTYSIEFELSGQLPRGETKVKGTVTIPVYATAVNPVNGKASSEQSQTITVQVNYEPDRGGPRRR